MIKSLVIQLTLLSISNEDIQDLNHHSLSEIIQLRKKMTIYKIKNKIKNRSRCYVSVSNPNQNFKKDNLAILMIGCYSTSLATR